MNEGREVRRIVDAAGDRRLSFYAEPVALPPSGSSLNKARARAELPPFLPATASTTAHTLARPLHASPLRPR